MKLHVALSRAWVNCEWERDALLARIVHIVGEDAPWMRVIVDDALQDLSPGASIDGTPSGDAVRRDIARRDVSLFDTSLGTAKGGWIDEVLARYGEPSDDEESEPFEPIDRRTQIQQWLLDHRSFANALRAGARARRPWIDPPEMRDSPWRVPALPTHGDLSRWFGISHERLAILADRRQLSRSSRDPRARHYRYAWIAKRTGGHRLIEAPKPTLCAIQRYVLDDILAKIPPHAAAHGFRVGHSVRTFAAPHVGRDVVLRVDLRAFFTSINAARVAAVFHAAGYPRPIAATLAALCTHATPRDVLSAAPSPADRELLSRHLPQGAPTSGALANLVAYRFDVRVAALAASLEAQYTRYADDLALSGSHALARAMPTIVARLGAIAIEEGFALNFRKTRMMRASMRQRLTGLVVNQRLAIARSDLEALRAILHNCVRFGPDSQNRAGLPDFRAHLQGRVSWVTSIDPRKGARLAAKLEQISW